MFEILFTQDSEIEHLNDFKHDFARMTNEADGSVFLIER